MADEQNTGGAAPADTGAPKTVSYDNFQRVVEAKTGLETQVKTLQSQLQSLTEKAATVDTLSTQLNEWKTKHAEAEGKFVTYSEFSGALGTNDPDVISVFDSKYKGLPEKDRPARDAWVKTLKEKPDDAPALLRPWLATGGGGDVKQKPPAPKVPGQPATPPNAPSSVSPEEVRRIREDAVRTGDWSKWKDLRKSMGLTK